MLTLLSDSPADRRLCIGTTTVLPPKPATFRPNPYFHTVLNSVLATHAIEDAGVQSQAQAMASSSGASGFIFNAQSPRTASRKAGGGAGPTASQGGAGSAGRGGWIHVYDQRHPPDFGRIPEPEDIFGSLEVDAHGRFIDGTGRWQESGTYRAVTNDGV